MKKFITLLMVLMVLGGAGFAEVTVSGQVDAVVMPLEVIAPDEGDAQIGAAVGRNGSGQAPRVRIGVAAGTEQVGIDFKVRFFANAASYEIDDFAEVWWKPISPLKIEAGKFVNDTVLHYTRNFSPAETRPYLPFGRRRGNPRRPPPPLPRGDPPLLP